MTIEEKYAIALDMLGHWVACVNNNGTGWDDWDEAYKDASGRPSPIREDLDNAIKENNKYWSTET